MKDRLMLLAEMGLGSRLNRLSGQFMKEIQLTYDHYNIDFDPYLFPIFKVVIDEKVTTTSFIQEVLQYTQPAITHALKKLSDKGLIDSREDDLDKRKKLFFLTRTGKKAHKRMVPLWKEMEEQVRQLTHFESKSLSEHLTEVEGKLKKKPLSELIVENLQHQNITI
ncbi:MarR family winged helix-turn-helix transcriptional regulator [Allomuricauda sp. SCSIO 65647]|uniref:MarR family winged helix-turn-helix transcriptional regulator n=1 Tax=Allomuricauda sp. SCSIO 65647 TaxID=2908843 RepID=UPI001F160923|nr:MarR family transcriptional regulator [Muricauda sp. SCSIO 65647]UJH68257.1 MarR family transcriptional regulator [Muricauda sp. SCSIO 65647]